MEYSKAQSINAPPTAHVGSSCMVRAVNWWQVVFIAAGSPALVMFSLGGISAVTGTVSPLVWFVSVMIGFVAIFSYAEIAGMHPNKSGGTAVYGATAWVRHSRIIAPMSVWSNWLAWSPILAIGSGLGSGYLLSIFLPPDHVLNTWQVTLLDLGFLKQGLTIRINTQFIVGTILMVTVWSIQIAHLKGQQLTTADIRHQLANTVVDRGTIVPLVEYGDGSFGAGVPGMVYEPFAASGRMMSPGYDYSNTEQAAAGASR